MSEQDELHWYALRTAPQKERTAAWLLVERFGFEAFVPVETRFRRVNRHARQKTEMDFPIMPGYVFAGFPPRATGGTAIPWLVLNRIPLIKGIVGYHEKPWRLDSRRSAVHGEGGQAASMSTRNGRFADFMGAHRNGKIKAPSYARFMATGREFEPGDEVDIISGAFRDYQRVKVVSIAGHMAKIMLPLFNKQAEVTVPLASLEIAA